MNTAIVPGSLAAVSEARGQSLAESFLSADAIVLVDVSGSMEAQDAPGGRTRYGMACDELARVQRELPGRVAVVAFSHTPRFVPGGQPPMQGANTDLMGALRFVQPADGTVKFILISDGYPDPPEDEILRTAQKFVSKIDVVYCGPEADRQGRDFLNRLARTSGGVYVESLKTANLGENVTLLLKAG